MRASFLLLALPLLACSSSEPPPTPDAAPVCNAFDAGPKGEAGPAIDAGPDADPDAAVAIPGSLRSSVDKVFALSCSFRSCHGSSPGTGKLFLPCTPTADMKCPENARTGDWWPQVVSRASTAHPTMKRVEPYDPQRSFLAHKVSEGLCALDKECVNGDCGDRMPDESDAVDPADRDTILAWIRQGAPQK